MPVAKVRRRVEEVLGLIGLEEYLDRMPSELSGGQRRRVAIAREGSAEALQHSTDPYLISFLSGWMPPLLPDEVRA